MRGSYRYCCELMDVDVDLDRKVSVFLGSVIGGFALIFVPLFAEQFVELTADVKIFPIKYC